MLLALVLPSLALTVPVRATLVETVEIGERPVAAGTSLSAQVRAMNPVTETFFEVTGERLLADQRAASGKGNAAFAADPAGSIRTWAVYYLDAAGAPVSDPDIVDVLFDDRGNGGVAARERGAAGLESLTITADGAVAVTVRDHAVAASFVGIVELRSDADGAALVDAPDLTVMDAEVYASYQALGLQAIVALDRFQLRVEGEVSVTGLSVSDQGVVEEGADLAWLVAFALPGTRSETWAYMQYEEAIGKVKRRSGEAPRVTLQPDDVLVETWDASAALSLPGDLRDLELVATLEGWSGETALPGGDAVVVDPSSVTVRSALDVPQSRLIVEGANGPVEASSEYTLDVRDARGATVASHTCTVAPASELVEGEQAVYVGSCTRDDATEVRRLRVTVPADGGDVRFRVDLAGAVFARDYDDAGECSSRVGCGDTARTGIVEGGSVVLRDAADAELATSGMEVRETDFHLPFAFDEDPTGAEARLDVEIADPTREGLVWSEADGVLTAREGDRTVHTLDADDVSVASGGDVAFKGKETVAASVPEEAASASLSLRVNRMTVRRASATSAPLTSPISGFATHLNTCCCHTGFSRL